MSHLPFPSPPPPLQFHDFAIEMKELLHDEARNVFKTVENFGMTVTSFALASQLQWPFVTMPHFEVRGQNLAKLSNSLMIGFSPLVQEDKRDAWERYATYQQGWIAEGLAYTAENPQDEHEMDNLHNKRRRRAFEVVIIDPNDEDPQAIQEVTQMLEHDAVRIPTSIHGHLDSAREDPDPAAIPARPGTGPYLPIWQQAPAPHDIGHINFDLFENEVFQRIFDGMNETLEAVLSEATDLAFYYKGAVTDDVTHPHSFLLNPVFADFNKTNQDHTHIVGVVVAILPWDHYYENILPPEAHGMIVKMESTCGDVMSYVINGPNAEFLGYGDFSDPKYHHLEESTLFAPFNNTTVSQKHNHCEYDIHIYPSWDLEQDYRTNHPVLYAVLVMGVFFMTTMVFVLYDYLVTMRQNKVMLAAKKSKSYTLYLSHSLVC